MEASDAVKLGIRITALDSRVDALFESCRKTEITVEDSLVEMGAEIKDLHRKLDVLAGAVKKLALQNGTLKKKENP